MQVGKHKEIPTYNLSYPLVSYINNYKNSHTPVEIAVHLRLIESEINYWMESLRELPAGAERARYVHKSIEAQRSQYYASEPKERAKVKCRRGCSFCCGPNIQITSDEADLLKERPVIGLTGRCRFLDKDGSCSVYEDRPATCRSIEVQSDPSNCRDLNGNILTVVILKSEIIATAALSTCKEIGPIDQMMPRMG